MLDHLGRGSPEHAVLQSAQVSERVGLLGEIMASQQRVTIAGSRSTPRASTPPAAQL
jgi:hypothetical protein